jgi:hypothetical protein
MIPAVGDSGGDAGALGTLWRVSERHEDGKPRRKQRVAA